MQLSAETVERVSAMWARWAAEGWPDDFNGVSVVAFAGERFVRAPAHLAKYVRDDPPVDLDELAAHLDNYVVHHSGSAWLAYGERESLRLESDIGVVAVPDDDPRLARLGNRAPADEWLDASVNAPCIVRVGVVEDDELLAAASVQLWDDCVGHIAVYTDHDARGRGLAARAASAVVAATLERGLVPQWRVRIDNDPSVRVAARLGFVAGGHQIFVRVRPATD